MITRTPGQLFLGLLGWLALCAAAAALGGMASSTAGGFYQQLARPGLAPPGWLFFVWQLGAVAFAEIVLLWLLILATLLAFWRVRPLAGALLG